MSNPPEQYKFFGDDNGDLLPKEKLSPKVIDVAESGDIPEDIRSAVEGWAEELMIKMRMRTMNTLFLQ